MVDLDGDANMMDGNALMHMDSYIPGGMELAVSDNDLSSQPTLTQMKSVKNISVPTKKVKDKKKKKKGQRGRKSGDPTKHTAVKSSQQTLTQQFDKIKPKKGKSRDRRSAKVFGDKGAINLDKVDGSDIESSAKTDVPDEVRDDVVRPDVNADAVISDSQITWIPKTNAQLKTWYFKRWKWNNSRAKSQKKRPNKPILCDKDMAELICNLMTQYCILNSRTVTNSVEKVDKYVKYDKSFHTALGTLEWKHGMPSSWKMKQDMWHEFVVASEGLSCGMEYSGDADKNMVINQAMVRNVDAAWTWTHNLLSSSATYSGYFKSFMKTRSKKFSREISLLEKYCMLIGLWKSADGKYVECDSTMTHFRFTAEGMKTYWRLFELGVYYMVTAAQHCLTVATLGWGEIFTRSDKDQLKLLDGLKWEDLMPPLSTDFQKSKDHFQQVIVPGLRKNWMNDWDGKLTTDRVQMLVLDAYKMLCLWWAHGFNMKVTGAYAWEKEMVGWMTNSRAFRRFLVGVMWMALSSMPMTGDIDWAEFDLSTAMEMNMSAGMTDMSNWAATMNTAIRGIDTWAPSAKANYMWPFLNAEVGRLFRSNGTLMRGFTLFHSHYEQMFIDYKLWSGVSADQFKGHYYDIALRTILNEHMTLWDELKKTKASDNDSSAAFAEIVEHRLFFSLL